MVVPNNDSGDNYTLSCGMFMDGLFGLAHSRNRELSLGMAELIQLLGEMSPS